MDKKENPYYRARKEAAEHNEKLCSRESTAELLGVSESTLANYELSVTKMVPADAVVMMADLYNAPELKSYYCANDCPIGRGMPIPTEINSIERITSKVMNALKPIEEAKEKLWEISADGKLTTDNLPTVMWLQKYLDDLSMTLGELRLTCQKFLAAGGVNLKDGAK